MWNWINEYSAGLSVLLSVGTLLVWIAYFQILLGSYTRQRRTKILINRGAGRGIESRCLISNMGAEPLYILTVIGVLSDDEGRIEADITDRDSSEVKDVKSVREGTSQGPLMSGEFMDIGRFSELMARCARRNQRETDGIESRFDGLEIVVIGAYGAEDLSVGARRCFTLHGGDTAKELVPDSVSTHQMRSRRERRAAESYLHNQLRQSRQPKSD
ncbi:hypothetical protein HCZ97_16670 [Pseudooceanicola sp. HF7]|nr:hypothetical protein [Pseudooceanicola sp. HF7]